MSPLRVGIDVRCLAEAEIRGWARYTLNLVEALAARDDIELTGLSDRPIGLEPPIELVLVSGRSEIVREQLGLSAAIRRLALDVTLFPANRGVPLLSPRPTVLTLHDAVEWDRELAPARSGRSALRFAYASAASLAAATRIVTVSQHSAADIRRRLGIAGSRLRVVREGAERRFFEALPPEAVDRIRERYGVPPGSVLYLGGFDPKKDVATLVRAFAELDPVLAPRLVLAGRLSPEASELRELAASLGLGDRVSFPGYVEDEDLPGLYRAASCFVFPSVAEGFGLPVIEAMASGTPVIVADAGALPELTGPGGQRFPAGEHGAAAAVLAKLLSSAQESDRWSKAAVTRAKAFSWEATADATMTVLREAAAVGTSRRLLQGAGALRGLHRWVR